MSRPLPEPKTKFEKFIYKHIKAVTTVLLILLAVIYVGIRYVQGDIYIASTELAHTAGQHELTWFHWVILGILAVLLAFAIHAMIRDRSEKQQEIYRQERVDAIELRKKANEERRQEMESAYLKMKEKRAARIAERGDTKKEWTPVETVQEEKETGKP